MMDADYAAAAVDRVIPAYHVEPCMHERWTSLRQLCDAVDRRLCLDCSAQFEVDLVDAVTTDDVCETCGRPRLRTERDLDGETT